MAVMAEQLVDRCERGYELNTRTLNNSHCRVVVAFTAALTVPILAKSWRVGWWGGGGCYRGFPGRTDRLVVEFDLIGLQTVTTCVCVCVCVTDFDGLERSGT